MGAGDHNEPHNASLQALRAIAALAVVVFHVSLTLPPGAAFDVVKQWCFFGFVGVDIFFVLSGYVVTRSALLIGSGSDARQFVLRRLGRVYGGYWPVLALGALLVLAGVPALNLQGDWLSSVFLATPWIDRNVLPVAYTLTYELWFYGLTTIALFAIQRSDRRRQAVLVAIAGLLVWQAILMLWDFAAWRANRVPLTFVLSGLNLEYLAGAFVAMIEPAWLLAHRRRIRLLGLLLLVAGSVALVIGWQWTGWTVVRAAICGAIGLGGLLLALSRPPQGADGGAQALLPRIGDASFSLYLMHSLVLELVLVGSTLLLDSFEGARRAMIAPIALVLAVLVALNWYRYVERPLYHAWCRWLTRMRVTA